MTVLSLAGAQAESVELLPTVRAYLADGDFAAGTVAVYGRTLENLVEELGGDRPVGEITRAELDRFLKHRYGESAPTTFNRNLAAVRSLFVWCEDLELVVQSPARKLKRRKERTTVEAERRSRPIPLEELQALWQDHRQHSLRDRTFWVMAYETAARANELLSLDIERLDQAAHTAITIGKGGSAETLVWASGTARLLPRLIGSRTTGPLFLTHRQPRSHVLPAANDRCPTTGKARLSYRQAEAIFTTASGGKTLHQIRHASVTHLAEAGVTVVELKAKSRHRSTRSLERYVNPSLEHVRKITNDHDTNRR